MSNRSATPSSPTGSRKTEDTPSAAQSDVLSGRRGSYNGVNDQSGNLDDERPVKTRLCPALDQGNVEQTMIAPVTAIVAHDTRFFEVVPKPSPVRPEIAARFGSLPGAARERLAFQGGTLQGAYVMLATRAVGLDCGPWGDSTRQGRCRLLPRRAVDVEFPISRTGRRSHRGCLDRF
jgi:hypothetical protein